MAESWDASFGHLRSLLQLRSLDASMYPEVWAALDALHALDRARYFGEVVPYAQGFAAHFRRVPLRDVGVLEAIAPLTPFATFALRPHGLPESRRADICDGAFMERVVALDLQGGGWSGKHLTMLADASQLQGLESLSLRSNLIFTDALISFAATRAFPNLRALDLSRNALLARGVYALAKATHLTRLETLDLRENELRANVARVLRRSRTLRSLNRVRV